MNTQNTCVIVATYNRKNLLLKSLDAIINQTIPPKAIFIIDNASTDGTAELLIEKGLINPMSKQKNLLSQHNLTFNNNENSEILMFYLKKNYNTGGAGAFYTGLKVAHNMQFEWLWIMDDDAIPDKKAHECLLNKKLNPNFIYGSSAVYKDFKNEFKLCWPALKNKKNFIEYHKDIDDITEVSSIPFLGFFISKKLVEKHGFPDKNFFISGDDVNYCEKLKKNGVKIFLIKQSLIFHPAPLRTIIKIFSTKISYIKLPPWKRYYETRNKLLTALTYYPLTETLLKTIPGILLRWLITLMAEKNKDSHSASFFWGIVHGLTNKKGKLWEPGASGIKK